MPERVATIGERKVAAIVALACALGFACWFAGGVPVLRHDWPSPYWPAASIVAAQSGWNPAGIGTPSGYPSSFIAAAVEFLLNNSLGSFVGTLIWQFFIALICASGAQQCVRAYGGSWIAQAAAAIFALVNPWAYNEVVAGHAFMLLSYGGSFWLIAEALQPTGDLRLIISGLLIAPQIQFFVLEWPLMLFVAVRDRRVHAATAWALLALPIVIGLFAARTSLVGTPLTLSWERMQSIEPLKAISLAGNFADYASFQGIAAAGVWIAFAGAVLGAICIFVYDRRYWPAPILTASVVAVAIGLYAPWQSAVKWAFANIPETGLLRELNDLLGFVAIGYVVLCAYLVRRTRFAAALIAAPLCLILGWIAKPPSTFWVAAQHVPVLQIQQEENTRFGLLPAFQPMQWEGRGSGIDPDVYARSPNVTPFNEGFAGYPVTSAFGSLLRDGDSRTLAALSVAGVYYRPYLQSDYPALRNQWSFQDELSARPLQHSRVTTSLTLSALPEMTLSGVPRVGTVDTNIGAGNVFFADAREVQGPFVPASWAAYGNTTAVKVPDVLVDAKSGWVDARLAFAERPELGQPFGGALTSTSRDSLAVTPDRSALVWVDGALLGNDGSRLSGATHGYKWVAIPDAVSSVRCFGTCVVALQGYPPPLTANPPAQSATGLLFKAWTPWLVVTTVPPRGVQMLRYNVRYDSHWIALDGGTVLPHVRIDGVVNGWILPPDRSSERIVILETGAAAISATEILCVIGLALLIVGVLRKNARSVRA